MQSSSKDKVIMQQPDKTDSNTPPRQILKVISWNLLHRSGALVEDIAGIIEDERPDLFLMQEVTEEIGVLPSLVGGGNTMHNHGRANAMGLQYGARQRFGNRAH